MGIDARVLTGKHQGTRTTLTALLRAVAKHRTAHDIIIYARDSYEAERLIGPSRFEFNHIGHSGAIRRHFIDFPRWLKRDRIDVGVFQYSAPPICVSRRLIFIHDILPITHPWYFPFSMRIRAWIFFTISMLQAACIVVVSDFTRRSVLARPGIAPEKVQLIYNGPSFEPETYLVEQGCKAAIGTRFVLAVGRIEKRKNIDLLIEAFLKAEIPDVRLVVVGAPDLRWRPALPSSDRVEFRGAMEQVDLINLYRSASLFVYPSAAEGFGIPLLDALLFGIPTITSDRSAMPEIADGLASFFDPTAKDSCDRLAGLIEGHFGASPIAPPDLAERQALLLKFNWDVAAERLLAAIDRIAP